MKALLLPLFLMFALAGCSSTEEVARVPDKSATELYNDAQESIASSNMVNAIQVLESIASRYPFGPHAQQVQFDLIYCYYKTENTAQGVATIDRFIRLNPTHPDLDYVLYMRGLMNLQAHDETFHRWLGIDRSDRDPSELEAAFSDLQRLLKDYPASAYAADARQRLIAIKQSLAKYELAVASYYMERRAYVAAANRSQHILKYFGDTPQAREAMEIMRDAYGELKLETLGAEAAKVLEANPG
ncbi:MAG: outer membrane protein assembly factor BamD [Gammaproteobacteria bacterium]|nr:outer membrane protein assembly factor BamD [Gammaproteobacteria bacterium]